MSLSNTLINSNLAFSASDILNLQENGANQFGKQMNGRKQVNGKYGIVLHIHV